MIAQPQISIDGFYVDPYIVTYDTLAQVAEKTPPPRFVFNHEKMSALNVGFIDRLSRAFIISEPGYGKSRLIDKLISENKNPATCVKADCKAILDGSTSVNSLLSETVTHVFFDGLDEVPPLQFLEALNQIGQLVNAHPALKIFIACRTHYLMRWKNNLEKFADFKYVVLQQFSEVHISPFR